MNMDELRHQSIKKRFQENVNIKEIKIVLRHARNEVYLPPLT